MSLVLNGDDNHYIETTRSGKSNVDVDFDYDEEGSDMDDEEIMNVFVKIKQDKKLEEIKEEMTQLSRVSENRDLQPIHRDINYEDSSDLNSPDDSFDDEQRLLVNIPNKKKWRAKHKSYKNGTLPQETVFYVGQEFDNVVQFRHP